MRVPLFNLKAQHQALKKDIERSFQYTLASTSFIMGEAAERFEEEFARYCGARYCAVAQSGTSALHLALMAHGIGEGDEVITQPNTFIATAGAISHAGAKPVFVDVDPRTYTLNPLLIEHAITKRTRAIMPVHLYGTSSDMDSIQRIAMKHNLVVIEDACQAAGSRFKDKKVGALGNTSCFSFYPSKILGACGEGGAVVTDSKRVLDKIKLLRNHGQAKRNVHTIIGYNYRMPDLQASFLRIKLKQLDTWIDSRRQNAHLYNTLLSDMDPNVVLPFDPEYSQSNYYLYAISCKKRNQLQSYLAKHGVGTQVYYPIALHLQKAYAFLGYKRGDFPVAEKSSRETLALPMYPELTKRQIRYVTKLIGEFYER